jgi:hypothetical protein
MKKRSNNGDSGGGADGGHEANLMSVRVHSDNVELGRFVDELMISEFQMEKLRSRLASKLFVQYVHKADVYYSPVHKKELSSSFKFEHEDKMYSITIDIKAHEP